MPYAADALDVLTELQENGAAVTFTNVTSGTYNPATDTIGSPTVTTVSGFAMQVGPDLVLYQALSLIQSEAPTLLFAPSTANQLPVLGATVRWGGTTYTVRSVQSIAPDGADVIVARVVVSV